MYVLINSRMIGFSSYQSMPGVFVSVIKFAVIKTPLIPENERSCTASGHSFACSLDVYSTLPSSTKKLFNTNFIDAGLGVDSAYTVITFLLILQRYFIEFDKLVI